MIQRLAMLCAGLCVVLAAGAAGADRVDDLVKDLGTGTAEKQLMAAMRLEDFVEYPDAVQALAAKAADTKSDAVLRARCAITLGRVNVPAVTTLLETLMRNTEEKAIVRAGCARSIAAIQGEAAMPEFIRMLTTEKSGIVRAQIEESLAKMPNPARVVAAVTPLLKVPAAETSAIRVLGATGGPAVIEPLTRQLNEGKGSTRRALIDTIGNILHPDAAQALVAYYPKANDAEKLQILGLLSRHPMPAVTQLLVSQLQDDKVYPAVRRRAALSLAEMRAKESIPLMVGIMLNADQDINLRLTCTQSLGEFREPNDAVIAGLIGALAEKKLAEEASLSLYRVTRRWFGTDREKWTQWYQQWQDSRGGQ